MDWVNSLPLSYGLIFYTSLATTHFFIGNNLNVLPACACVLVYQIPHRKYLTFGNDCNIKSTFLSVNFKSKGGIVVKLSFDL